ncbi:MAG: CBS domain-containing protein [Chitinophagaceae bacterium]|jgi:CBS domain-containing protein|nr:CBS domain-containing protein [Chitinophagaceae bacterium]OQY91995.1 MAG: histidine kinase [Sphingobacteriales bacterium UTBCD1]
MSKVASILSRKGRSIVSISPGTAVLEALKLMSDKNIGSVVVMEGEKYLGIITERDYSRKVILKGKNSGDTKVSEIMSTDLPAVRPTDSIEHCRELMSNKNIRYLPVFDGDRIAGIVSMSDVVKETILVQKETIHHLESYIRGDI